MGIYKDNMPDLGNNMHCFAPKLYKMSQNYQPQQTRGLSMLVFCRLWRQNPLILSTPSSIVGRT